MRFIPAEHQDEIELTVKSAFGMRVTVIFTPESKRSQEQHNNVTEVHWLYNRDKSNTPLVAIESDIHKTGGTIFISKIDTLIVENETQLDTHPSYTW